MIDSLSLLKSGGSIRWEIGKNKKTESPRARRRTIERQKEKTKKENAFSNFFSYQYNNSA